MKKEASATRGFFGLMKLILVVVILGAAGFLVFRLFWARGPVDPAAWTRVKVGMSKYEVRWVLGGPTSAVQHSPAHFWEYGYGKGFIIRSTRTEPYLNTPFPDAYVIHFDANNKVNKKQGPRRSDGD